MNLVFGLVVYKRFKAVAFYLFSGFMVLWGVLMPRMRKGAVQIRFEILEFLYYHTEPQLRTYIWRRATTLSYDDFLKHFAFLKEKHLVRETQDGSCRITEKGREVYDELRNALSSIL